MSADVLSFAPFRSQARDPGRVHEALHRFTSALRIELLPDDPPTPLDVAIRSWQGVPDFMVYSRVGGAPRRGDVMRARPALVPRRRAEPPRRQPVDPGARGRAAAQPGPPAPPPRRRGRARGGAYVADRAATDGKILGGAAFMRVLGANPGLETRTNQLVIADVNRDLVRAWQRTRARARPRIRAGAVGRTVPRSGSRGRRGAPRRDEHRAARELVLEDSRVTPALLRQMEKAHARARNRALDALRARDRDGQARRLHRRRVDAEHARTSLQHGEHRRVPRVSQPGARTLAQGRDARARHARSTAGEVRAHGQRRPPTPQCSRSTSSWDSIPTRHRPCGRPISAGSRRIWRRGPSASAAPSPESGKEHAPRRRLGDRCGASPHPLSRRHASAVATHAGSPRTKSPHGTPTAIRSPVWNTA